MHFSPPSDNDLFAYGDWLACETSSPQLNIFFFIPVQDLQQAFLNFEPKATYTRKFEDEFMDKARCENIDSLFIHVGGFSQHSGGPLQYFVHIKI